MSGKKFLFIFLDGVGLGKPDPRTNPFANAEMPFLQRVLNGNRLLANAIPLENQRASLLALDACLGVAGIPQSATGQATLLTGKNVPAAIGYHYGPKPNPPVAEFLQNGNLFGILKKSNRSTAFLNAYPPRYFEAIQSGKRIYSAIPMAATSSSLKLKTLEDLHAGRALSADFTSQGWSENLGLTNIQTLSPKEAGSRLADLALAYDFAFFEYWLSDYAGHKQDMPGAIRLIEIFDEVLDGLLERWDDQQGLVLVTSDHGNMEDLSTRRHTTNPVPALIFGAPDLRRDFTRHLHNLADIAPAVIEFLSF
jgi:2,3-bisphosphoglycerate-independent phosphoglycerate mutase